MYNTEEKQAIARTIINQLGFSQSRMKVMIGAKNFVALESGLQFKFVARAKSGINHMTIKLNGMDTYDVEFWRITKAKFTKKSEHGGMYADQLKGLFESETGLYLSL